MPRGGARSKSGPERQYENRIMLKLTTQMLDGIDSIVREGETRSEVMRRALEREVKRCLSKAGAKASVTL